MSHSGFEDGLIGQVLAVQAWKLEFRSSAPLLIGMAHECNPSAGKEDVRESLKFGG